MENLERVSLGKLNRLGKVVPMGETPHFLWVAFSIFSPDKNLGTQTMPLRAGPEVTKARAVYR